MTQYIQKLPAVFQTVTEKKFFDATFDQVFSKKDSDYLAGYIGRRNPGFYNPIKDFYLPEPTKDRTWWQLEATAYARDPDTTKTNVFFYDDLLDRINYYGGNTLNEDRLFESEYYSFGPPIDYDMFINYHNYYWVEQGLPTIEISGVLAIDIIGKQSYATPATATPPNLTLTTGMTISLLDDPDYISPHIVENLGGCDGLILIERFTDVTAGTVFEFLPWDGILELANGRLIYNQLWDALPWEVQAQPTSGDYITIERGALDRNAWSRTNKWFHISAINATINAIGSSFPTNAVRALRPIIQFIADIPLYKSGTQFRQEIQFGFRKDTVGVTILLADYQGDPLATINAQLDISMTNGDLVVFMDDPAASDYIWQANVDGFGITTFTEYTSVATPVLEGDIVFVTEDAPFDGAKTGETWYYSGGFWNRAFNDKVYLNQPPLFLLYDHNGIELDDPVTYPDSTFLGSEIFSYKVNTTTGATVDPVLKFPIVFTSLGQSSDIVFQNDLITSRYVYSDAKLPISGYYYYKTSREPILYNNWNLYNVCECPTDATLDFQLFSATAGQTVFNTVVPTLPNSAGKTYLQVFVNGIFQIEGVADNYQVTGPNEITFNVGLSLSDDVVIYAYLLSENAPEFENYTAGVAQTVFNTAMSTVAETGGQSFLYVYINGVLQQEGITKNYQVTGPNQITLSIGASLGDDVTILGFALANLPPNYDSDVATSGQAIFGTTFVTVPATLTNSYVNVFVNGIYQVEGVTGNYQVTGSNEITFNSGLALGDDVVMYGAPSVPQGYCPNYSKQRVIDKYVVGYGTEYQFKISVEPYGYVVGAGAVQPLADIIVSVNGIEILPFSIDNPNGYLFEDINNRIYVDLNSYLTLLLTTTQSQPPVVELQTYTRKLLDPAEPGYFEIPQQLEANPSQLEVGEITASDLTEQFSSIISNQVGFEGSSFGGSNNYRDTRKNRSLGQYILQNVAPILKSMLVSSSNDLDFILGTRFSQDEYTKFKNKYISTAKQLINQEFSPVQYYNNSVNIAVWVTEILKILNVSKEFSNAFAYSYMAAAGTPFASETFVGPGNSLVSLASYVDLSDPRNVLYVYDTTNPADIHILTVGVDYNVISTNLVIDVQLNMGVGVKTLFFALYKEPLPTYIPSTPTKVGAYPIYLPRMEWDATYVNPTWVIIGHDGSKTIAYGDYRDNLLLELERRIYNGLQERYRNQYNVPLLLESVKSGYFRQTRYSREEYLEITESYINKWSAKNRANYRTNEWATASLEPSVVPNFIPGVGNIWKLYNYALAVTPTGVKLNLPGNWKGIFQYYYDTYNPDTQPWNMLGFSDEPSWWRYEYGNPVINLQGQEVWTSTAFGNNDMWEDLENGIIRQGPRAIYDPVTLQAQQQELWERPGLSTLIPVDSAGEIIPVMTLFNVAFSGNYYAPFDHFDDDWLYGAGAPVEQAWMSTSGYAYSVQEFLFLMRPGPYGELMWDTIGTELSPGLITVPDSVEPVMSNTNWQYVQNDSFTSSDEFFEWMRPKNKDQVVHAEIVDGVTNIRFGYQRWISDRILFLGKNIGETFGQKIRTLDVNLANKLAGFTNKDTTSTYIESVTPGATTSSLLIPTNNFDVFLHKSPPIDTYAYSGVIVRALADGTFVIYGYDLLKSDFTIYNRSTEILIDVTIGGTPAAFQYFEAGATYNQGDIVRYNGVYYESKGTQVADRFITTSWFKLKALPITGGVSVSYKPVSLETTTRIPYGSILKNAQEVFDMLIGWGAYLEKEGWQFQEVNPDTNQVSDWLYSAKQFLFWLNTNWAPDASIQLSPLANSATLIVKRGYPNDVETMSNGVYSILDKGGVAIAPNNTLTDREGPKITVAPAEVSVGGIYFLQITTSETEHILIFDNRTSFNDVIYSPLLRARQQRLRFNGFRSNLWYGKMEAPGYLIIDNQLVPNYDSIVEDMRYYYDANVTIDNPSLEDLGRALIGYESKSYLDNLQVSNDVQYLFYKGAIRQKGTQQAFDKLFRSTKVQSNETIEVFEEWALKLADFGNTIEQVSTEFILRPEQNTGEVIVARLNYIPSPIGRVRQVRILNAENTYTTVPRIVISAPDADPFDINLTEPLRQARAFAVLDSLGRISRVDVTDPGYGYLTAAYAEIDSGVQPHNLDKLYTVWQGAVQQDVNLDNIVDIDIDEVAVWTVRPPDPAFSLEFPVTNVIDYPIPNAGYVNFNDVDWSSFDVAQTAVRWGTEQFNPVELDTVWVAKNFIEDWDVYKLVNLVQPNYIANTWQIVDDAGNLLLLTNKSVYSTLSVIPQAPALITTELVNGFIESITVLVGGSGYIDATPPIVTITDGTGVGATADAVVVNGTVTEIIVTAGGSGYVSPVITIALPGSGVQAMASANVLFQVGLDAIVDPGGYFSSVPTLTLVGDSPVPADATATILNGVINSVTIANYGGGYTSAPGVLISDADPIVLASLTPVVNSNGAITSVVINDGGSGYTLGATIVANRAVTPDPSYTDAVFSITSIGPIGEITGVSVVINGTGYSPTPNTVIVPQFYNGYGSRTDFGNMIVLQEEINGVVNPVNNYTVGITPFESESFGEPGSFTDPITLIEYNAYSLITLDGVPITINEIGNFAVLNTLLLFKSMRWRNTPVEPLLPTYVGLDDKIWVDDVAGKWTVFNIQADPGIWDINAWDPLIIDFWSPNYGWDVNGPLYFNPFRVQAPLINTSLFESASVFATRTSDELVLLPVYDPFKNIIVGPAKQNITYMLTQDPARYNITGDVRLFSENITFAERQIGQLWWDLSTTRFVYYEQPIALDGSETPTDNLIYRRDRWAQIFPGSTVDIYEWVKSPVPPAEYTGTGTPKTIDSYVQVATSNRFTNITTISYYFWVIGATDRPNVENRTLAAVDVARLIQTPKSQAFAFFAPIQQTAINNAYMFYNVQEILAYQGDNIQIQYRLSERDDQEHAQWAFFREGDRGSLVTDQFWDKMVDSLCGYTRILPISDEYSNSIIIAKDLPWDIYGWDISAWDEATNTNDAVYGEILPVPDPTLSEAEKYGVQYRPRQGMFVKLQAARKVFVQAANELLKHIPIRDDNPSWNADVATDIYWDYTNWYAIGYEDAVPTIVYATLALANAALTLGQLSVSTILQVVDGTLDGRYVLYVVTQLNPNIPILSLEEVAIENSAIKLLDTIYTTVNRYDLSIELRELLNAFRTQVMTDTYLVDQNELFFSMTNYVLSEQKNPDWVFKSSYIYIKENNIPLSQSQLYIPDQIDNIIKYILDAKPYHTKIRDYTSTYVTSDLAIGTASDSYKINTVLTFGPDISGSENPGHWDAACDSEIPIITDAWGDLDWGTLDWELPSTGIIIPAAWDNFAWDVCLPAVYVLNALTFADNVEQFVSREDVYTVDLTFFDISKVGLSQLYPYTFNILTLNDPQTFIPPENIVGVQIGTTVLIYGQDYYADYNFDTEDYTIYFYNDPGNSPVPVALVWFNGGEMLHFRYSPFRNEIAYGFPVDNLVVNVDTKLPVNTLTNGDNVPPPVFPDGTLTPYVGWGDVWEGVDDPVVSQILIDAGGTNEIPWDTDLTLLMLDNSISSKENTNTVNPSGFYRNADRYAGELVIDLPAPTLIDENIDVITVFVDPLTHPFGTDILTDPGPGSAPGVIWIDGERIEYRMKTATVANTWELQLVRRGTKGTAPTEHLALVPEVDPLAGPSGETVLKDPPVLVPNKVWVERNNIMPLGADVNVWNASNTLPDLSTEGPVGEFTSVTSVPTGGLWYALTDEAEFLKQAQGESIP